MYSTARPLPEFEARLLFDALDCSNRNLLLRMRYSDSSRLRGVLELFVAANLRNFEPAVFRKLSQNFPTVHDFALSP